MKGWISGSALAALATLAGCAATQAPAGGTATVPVAVSRQDAPPRVILIIGDGVGLAQWSLLQLATDSLPAVSRLPHTGLVDTRCACGRTTDSGAAATAFATAMRTGYRFVGVGPDSTPLETVLEAAERRGLATGLVTTTFITDATPAAFAAHIVSRYDRLAIAAQMAGQGIEVLLGGGWAHFARRPDGRDLVAELRRDYTVVRTPAEFARVDAVRTPRLLGLFADSLVWPHTAQRPTLPHMARTALAILERDPDGFFLLLESEDTDEVFHDTLAVAGALPAMRELDAVVATALEYQQRNAGTLVVVLGDHETGGLALQLPRDGTLTARYTTTDHTAGLVPVFAGGPGAERFGRWLTNAQVGALLFDAVGAPRRPRR